MIYLCGATVARRSRVWSDHGRIMLGSVPHCKWGFTCFSCMCGRQNSIVICNCRIVPAMQMGLQVVLVDELPMEFHCDLQLCQHRKNIPPAMSQRFQTTWCFGKVWQHAGGAGDLQSATVFPGFLPFRYTCKSIAFWQSCAIFRKKGLSGPQVLPRSGPNSEDEQSHGHRTNSQPEWDDLSISEFNSFLLQRRQQNTKINPTQ